LKLLKSMVNEKKYFGHLSLLCVNIFFGLNMAISKDLLNCVITPVGLNSLRFLAGAAGFWLISLFKWENVTKSDMLILLIGAVFGLMGNQIFFIQGLSRTSPVDASIISTTVPIITMVLSAIILKEPISFLKVFGVLVGAGGALFLVLSSQNGSDKQSSLTGDLLCLGSALSYSLFLVITKPVTQRYSSVTIMKWMFLFAAIFIIPFSIKEISSVNYATMGNRNALSLTFVLICATIIPYLLIPIGQKKLRPTTQSMYNYVQPIVAVFIAIIAGTNVFTAAKCIAAAMVFLGVYIVTLSKSRADVEAEKMKHTTP
jgi:drug/metabolite transporter (DMT)-like permease